MLLVSDDFILDLESMNHKLTNTMLWPSKYISLSSRQASADYFWLSGEETIRSDRRKHEIQAT